MTDPTPDDLPTDEPEDGPEGDAQDGDGASPIPCSYRSALATSGPWRLRAILKELGVDPGRRSLGLDEALAEHLDAPSTVGRILDALGPEPHQAFGLFSRTETPVWPAVALGEALLGLGVDPARALDRPLALGLVAPMPAPDGPDDQLFPLVPGRIPGLRFVAHPAALESTRIRPPLGDGPATLGEPARLVRESDGLEPVLRLAALWQLADAAPLKRTRQGDLYKRDRQRLDEDPALAGPIADVLRPVDDPVSRWLNLARSVGLLLDEPDSDRIVSAPSEFWGEHGVHLPQMIAARWLGGGDLRLGPAADPGSSLALRIASLLALASAGEDDWFLLEELATWLGARMHPPAPAESKPERRKGRPEPPPPDDPMLDALHAALLGPAYLLGLVRVGESGPGGLPAVQLSPRGRYVLGLGPPPPPPPRIEQFLFVQPNFEIVAYRQGMNPALIGRLSRFARWEQLGSALTLRLNSDSIDRGLASGLSAGEIRDWLGKHAVRPLPDGVSGAIDTWAGRRDRLTYFSSATLIEFGSPSELEEALADWPEGPSSPPMRVADRVLLVEDEGAIPFKRFRLAGARDYRRPPETCVGVGADGVSLSADPARGDLFVEAELSRFADLDPDTPADALRRRYVVSPESLRRASAEGMTAASLSQWYAHRTGGKIPPAVRLIARLVDLEGEGLPPPLKADRPLLLRAPDPEILDGLLQHPDTRPLLGDRLGPTAAVVRSVDPAALRDALRRLGVRLDLD
ncbi:helicase-associated domain-containing protein [Tautonia plasticadhaerens]|nr:helicase-associated domain-containing protein [Tautonia plasticadhaerens]